MTSHQTHVKTSRISSACFLIFTSMCFITSEAILSLAGGTVVVSTVAVRELYYQQGVMIELVRSFLVYPAEPGTGIFEEWEHIFCLCHKSTTALTNSFRLSHRTSVGLGLQVGSDVAAYVQLILGDHKHFLGKLHCCLYWRRTRSMTKGNSFS